MQNTQSEISPTGRWAPVRYPVFRRVVAARAISTAGQWMQVVAAGWLIFQLTGSAAAVGVLTIASRGPAIVSSAYGGVLVDRYDQRRIGLWVSLIQALAAAALAVSAASHDLSVVEVFAATLVIGVGAGVANPLMQGIVPRSVPPGLISPANSINVATYNVARMLGPLAGGGLVPALGVEACFALNSLSFLAVVAMFAAMPRELSRPKRAEGGVRAALGAAREHRLVVVVLIWVATFSLLIAPIQELAPAIASEHGDGAHLVGFMLGALAFGSVVGSLVVGRLGQKAGPGTT